MSEVEASAVTEKAFAERSSAKAASELVRENEEETTPSARLPAPRSLTGANLSKFHR